MSHFQSQRFNDLSENYDDINPVSELKKNREKSNLKVLDITQSNPTKLGFLYPKEMILHEVTNEFSWEYEPNPQGLLSARIAIQQYYLDRTVQNIRLKEGQLFHPDKFFLASGTSEAYSLVLKSITNPSDEILVQAPGYPLLDFLAKWELVEAVTFETVNDIESKITNKTRAILIVQPNNPDGKILSAEEISAFEEIAYKYNLVVIVDEVFADYVDSKIPYHFFVSNRVPVITLNGLSKLAGLPGLKLAWIHLQIPDSTQNHWKEIPKRLEWLTDSYLSVNSIVQEILPTILGSRHMIQNQIRNRIRRNYAIALDRLSDCNEIKIPPYMGGWYINIVVSIDKSKLDEMKKNLLDQETETFSLELIESLDHPDEIISYYLLQKFGIYLHTGSMFNFPNQENLHSIDRKSVVLILSLIVKEEDFFDSVSAIASFFL